MDDILKNADRAEELASTFATRISRLEAQVTEREEALLTEAERFRKTSPHIDASAREVVRAQARQHVQRETRAFRRNLSQATEKERVERLKELMEMDETVAKLEPLHASPVQMLSRVGLGSPERTNYQEQLRHAGPRELENHAKWAIARGGKILAAAVLSRLDAMPTKSRPLNTREFAEKLVGEEFERLQSAFRRTRLAAQRAINANRDFERGQVRGVSKIALGLAARR
jgi:hypothetical protein